MLLNFYVGVLPEIVINFNLADLHDLLLTRIIGVIFLLGLLI